MEETELLTADERADVLNLINYTLDNNHINLKVCAYDDTDGVFFEVILFKKNPNKPVMELEETEC